MRRFAFVIALTLVGCDISGSDPLPDGYFQDAARAFKVELDSKEKDSDGLAKRIRPMTGLDAAPVSSGKLEDTSGSFQISGVATARFPKGWGCDLTLNSIFQNNMADPDSIESYTLPGFERIIDEFASRVIAPIWQAQYDIGRDSCVADGNVGRCRLIGDPTTWGKVVYTLFNHLDKRVRRYSAAQYGEPLAALGLRPGYVELLPDPMGSAGYSETGFDFLIPVYSAFFEALEAARVEQGASQDAAIIAPSFRVAGLNEVTAAGSPTARFVDFINGRAGPGPDVWSLLATVASPQEHLELFKEYAKLLPANAAVGDLAMRVAPTVWQKFEDRLVTQKQRSNYLGAFAAVVRILQQDNLELFVLDRWGGPGSPYGGTQTGEDLFFDSEGKILPAMIGFMPFSFMANGHYERVRVVRSDSAAASGDVYVLAGKNPDGKAAILVAALPKAGDDRIGYQVNVELNITGLGIGNWEMQRLVIDQDSTSLRYVERSKTPPPLGGALLIERHMVVPSVQYFELSPVL